MSDEIVKLEHSGFVSKSCSEGSWRGSGARYNKSGEAKQKKRGSQAAWYLAIRLGVCVLLFCAVLAIKLAKGEKSAAVLSLLNELPGSETEQESRPGRLRFVQIPSIIQVFAHSSEPSLPLEASAYELIEDDTLLALTVRQGDDAHSPCTGTVKAVGTDERLGDYVAVLGADDTEYRVFGLADIGVENGQPLTQNSILGKAAGQTLFIKVFYRASPENPLEYFKPDKMQ